MEYWEPETESLPDRPFDGVLQMMHFGRDAWSNPDKVIKSANFVQHEVGAQPGLEYICCHLTSWLDAAGYCHIIAAS